jgi:hypothetical protein
MAARFGGHFSVAAFDFLLATRCILSKPASQDLFVLLHPCPPAARLGLIALLGTLKRNPMEYWSADFFREPIPELRLPFTEAFLVHDPASIKHFLVDDAGNYRKDPINDASSRQVSPMGS